MKSLREVLESLADQLDNVVSRKYYAGTIGPEAARECGKLYRQICETAARLPIERPKMKPATHVRDWDYKATKADAGPVDPAQQLVDEFFIGGVRGWTRENLR